MVVNLESYKDHDSLHLMDSTLYAWDHLRCQIPIQTLLLRDDSYPQGDVASLEEFIKDQMAMIWRAMIWIMLFNHGHWSHQRRPNGYG